MKKYCFLLILLIEVTGASQILAQSGSQITSSTLIKGQVSDSLTNEVIAYATLKIAKNDSTKNVVKMLATDTNGKYPIERRIPFG